MTEEAQQPNLKEYLNNSRIHCFLNKGRKKMHEIFRNRWSIYRKLDSPNEKSEWGDGEKCGKIIAELCASSIGRDFEEKLKIGKIELWDITLTKIGIKHISDELLYCHGIKKNKQEDNFIYDINRVRNAVDHGNYQISDDTYKMYCDQLTDILIKAGDDPDEIEAFKKSLLEQQLNVSEIVDEKAIFVKLLKEGDELLKKNDFNDAIEKYSEALDISGILPDNLAIVYSNRSLARLELNTSDSLILAERDAKFAIQLSPFYSNGHYHLAKIYIKLQKWSEAESELKSALSIDDDFKETRDDLSFVTSKIGIMSNHDHINPALQQPTIEEIKNTIKLQTNLPETFINQMYQALLKTDNVLKGYKFTDENPPNYEEAAKCYAKAANDGDPLGMCHLGYLFYEGKGVKRDYKQALFWYKRAANTKLDSGTEMGTGIPEAQCNLALMYMDGIGVKKDYSEASEWYRKAAHNGDGGSANNLGVLYQRGQGVEKSPIKAYEYFYLSAKLGATHGMINLAKCYFNAEGTGSVMPTEDDIDEGIKWLRIASKMGDLNAIHELERHEQLSPKIHVDELIDHLTTFIKGNMSNPLDQDQFGKPIKEMAKNGSKTAVKLVEIWNHMDSTMDAFKNGNHAEGISSLSKAIRLDNQIVKIPELLTLVIEKWFKTHPDDLDAITCNMQLNPIQMLEKIEEILKKFSKDEYFLEMQLYNLLSNGKKKEAVTLILSIIKIYPKSLCFLYLRGIVACSQEQQTDSIVFAFDAFLAAAPADHENVPSAHYNKALYYLVTKKDDLKFFESYETGLESEKNQLPCFLPYEFAAKKLLEKSYQIKNIEIQRMACYSDAELDLPSTSFSSIISLSPTDLILLNPDLIQSAPQFLNPTSLIDTPDDSEEEENVVPEELPLVPQRINLNFYAFAVVILAFLIAFFYIF